MGYSTAATVISPIFKLTESFLYPTLLRSDTGRSLSDIFLKLREIDEYW